MSYSANTYTFSYGDIDERRYPVVNISVAFHFLPILSLFKQEIKSQSWLAICLGEWALTGILILAKEQDFIMQSTWFVILCLLCHFSLVSFYDKDKILIAWFFCCFSDIIFLRILSCESVYRVYSWWHFASPVTTLNALVNEMYWAADLNWKVVQSNKLLYWFLPFDLWLLFYHLLWT